MASPHLIFVEGIPGAGKTVTSKHIAKHLVYLGEQVRLYGEFDQDNPIRTVWTEALHFPWSSYLLDDKSPDTVTNVPPVYIPVQWKALALQCKISRETVILESRYIQNSVQLLFLFGAPVQTIRDCFMEINSILEQFDPLLVYLQPVDLARTVRCTLKERGNPWASWIIDRFTRSPWCVSQGLSGEEGIVAFYQAWELIASDLYLMHQGPTIKLVDPQKDWSGTYERIKTAVRHI